MARNKYRPPKWLSYVLLVSYAIQKYPGMKEQIDRMAEHEIEKMRKDALSRKEEEHAPD